MPKRSNLDWNAVRQIAFSENVAPLFYHLTRNRKMIPADMEQDLSAAYYDTAIRNTLQFNDLEEILVHLTERSVPVILLKGAALAETLYRNLALRPMEDIDLLVRPESLPAAFAAMSECCATLPAGENKPGVSVDHEHEVMFQKSGKTSTVFDLHWNLLDSPYHPHSLITDWLWSSAAPIQIGKSSALMLGREALLLHLCCHLLIDRRKEELLWLYDIAFAITRYQDQMDWELLLVQAQRYGLVLPVKRALAKACEEWHVLIPNGIQAKLSSLRASPSEAAFYDWSESEDRATVRLLRVNLASMPGWSERFGYIWSNLFPPADFMQRRYHASNRLLTVLAYPYRWFLSLRRAIFR